MDAEISHTSLSNSDFTKLSSFIYDQCGIKMPRIKKIMVEARLRKRLKELNIPSYSQYCEFLFSNEGQERELIHMIDVITTNKTDFFREPKQFSFMIETAVPQLFEESGAGIRRPLRIWSAGCSTGEEPYTISIVLNEFRSKTPDFSFEILATDISTKVLEKAIMAVYDDEKVEPIPYELLHKYFLRSKDRTKGLYRVVPEIRDTVNFQRLNFMDDDFGIKGTFDIIFCRNVIIYFDKPTQDRIITRLINYIRPGGYLFLGHSESIFNTSFPVKQISASTYKKEK